MTLKRAFLLLLVLTTAVAFAATNAPQCGCTNKSAKGTYGYNCNGVAPNPFNNFAIEPFAGYGVVTSDGRGQWNGHGKVSFNGAVHSWTHDTSPDKPATVNSDCTGNVEYVVTLDGAPVPDAHFDFVIVDGGREVKGFPTDAGYGVTCQLILERGK